MNKGTATMLGAPHARARSAPVRWLATAALACGLALLGGCGGPGGGSKTGKLTQDLSKIVSPFQVVDLVAGTVQGQVAIPDLDINPAYRSTLMVFHLVPAGSATLGTPIGGLGAGSDAPATTVSMSSFYCGVFEVTQGQWQTLAATTPWTTLSVIPAGAAGSLTTDANTPAYGLSEVAVQAALLATNAGKPYSLAIPSDAQWEYACRGGTSTAFWWGNDPNSRSAAVNNAVVLETNGTNLGPRQVGQKSANPFGLYDMLGNVWELTHTGSSTSIRGGSWNDTLAQARCANTVAIDRGTAHALVGVRLILVP